MKHLLAPGLHKVLSEFAPSRVVLAFDFDGTLAPIVADRRAATMRSRTRQLLSELGRLYPCVVISGRSRSDTASRTRSCNLVRVVGNHGLEPGNAARASERFSAIVPVLRLRLRDVAGIDIENKRFSVAIHYRRSRDKRAAREAIRAAAIDLPIPVRLMGGKQLVNVLPRGALGKGRALEKLRRELGVDRAIYVGDDVTDEDVFSSKQSRLLSVRIGRSAASAAAYFLRNQREIDRLLARLIVLRSGAGPRARIS